MTEDHLCNCGENPHRDWCYAVAGHHAEARYLYRIALEQGLREFEKAFARYQTRGTAIPMNDVHVRTRA